MQIRDKLTYQFVGIVASVLLASTITIYLLFAQFRERELYNRLNEKASATATLLFKTTNIDASLLKSIDKNLIGILPQEKVIIIDDKEKVIFKSDDSFQLDFSIEKIRNLRQKKNVKFSQNNLEFTGLTYQFNNIEYLVIVGAYDKYGFRKLQFLGGILIGVFILSIVVVYFLGRVFAERALQPISTIIYEVENITVSNLSKRIDEGNGQDEISHLAKTFNTLLYQIDGAFKSQRSFVGNASHELRNPLSIIRGQLEVALLKDRNKDDYRATMESILEDINRLTSISNRLLSLAQVSGGGMVDPKEELRVDDLLMEVHSELVATIPEYIVNISFESILEDDNSLLIAGNKRLLKIAFFNLMENACKYSSDQNCEIEIGVTEKSIRVSFSDNGLGIPEEDLENIFEPFYRSKNVLDRTGHGIGLSLVQNIIKLHKGTIALKTKINVGTTFTITLPSEKV